MTPNRWTHILRIGLCRALAPFRRGERKPFALVFGFRPWADALGGWLSDHNVIRCNRDMEQVEFWARYALRLIVDPQSRIYVWAFKNPAYVETFSRWTGVPLIRVEDGFIRSISLGATKSEPLSLCIDSRGLYFDPTICSDLETMLQTNTLGSDELLMTRARAGIARLLDTRLSKYNFARDTDIEVLYGPKKRRRVLVVGQVEGDMSLVKGSTFDMDNNDLVRVAARENPDAQIIYKPHPEVLAGTRKEPPQSDPRAVADIALVIDENVTLADTFRTIDHVYTMTSLSGFEALLRGIKVTCFGMPFYAGWGATDDRQHCARRTTRRSVEEIFAAAYLLYPRYYDPETRAPIDFEQAISALQRMREASRSAVTPAEPAP